MYLKHEVLTASLTSVFVITNKLDYQIIRLLQTTVSGIGGGGGPLNQILFRAT